MAGDGSGNCRTSPTGDQMAEEFEVAPERQDVTGLAAMAAYYRARAATAEGQLKGQALLIEYFKHRVEVLEARDRGEDVVPAPA